MGLVREGECHTRKGWGLKDGEGGYGKYETGSGGVGQ